MNSIKKFIQLKPEERSLFFEAYFTLIWVRILLIFTSFKFLSRKLDIVDLHLSPEVINEKQMKNVKKISKSIKQASNYVLGTSTCLVQSVSVQKMLKKRSLQGSLYVGVSKDDVMIHAHAWIQCNDEIVIGEYRHDTYKVMLMYTWKVDDVDI